LVGVLALQGDVREHIRALEAAGARAVPVRRERELEHVDALVIPGGESTTMDKLVRAFDLLDPIRQRIKEGMPAYGSCAGMIMLADRVVDAIEGQQTIGGIDIAVRRNAFGRQVDSFEEDLELTGLPEAARPLRAVFIRAPWVESAGPDVEVLATVARTEGPDGQSVGQVPTGAPGGGVSSAHLPAGVVEGHPSGPLTDRNGAGPARIVAVRQGPLLATAFHPELSGDLRVHTFFVDLVRSALRGADGRPGPGGGSRGSSPRGS
jgi:5'-phosphate synthase pdxT subunit